MHHKVFIIDGKTVVTGSFNPSKNGDSRNDENILIIRDETIASRYLAEYERLR
ncbi:phospholipase, partial [Candidatus Woesearchaeota archaeon]|nr:phospholipase [Candidatus Woesearchaeota archaeon]